MPIGKCIDVEFPSDGQIQMNLIWKGKLIL